MLRIASAEWIAARILILPKQRKTTIDNGRKIIAFRTEATVNAIKKAMAACL
jgi:hypothetical protein